MFFHIFSVILSIDIISFWEEKAGLVGIVLEWSTHFKIGSYVFKQLL